VRRLSAGFRQRAAIARALLHPPTVLRHDEPATGLDPLASAQAMERLAAEQARGAALVLVSHTVHEAWPLASHAHALVRGAWALSGPAVGEQEEFLHRYREALRG
jgi:ABC-type multidrug transport system ATPase subunit